MGSKFSEAEKFQLIERFQNGESVSNICLDAGIPRSTFYTWLRLHEAGKIVPDAVISPAELAMLKRQSKRLEEMVEVLKKVECTMSAPLKEKLYALEALHGQYSVHLLCDALEVSRGTYYNHILRNKKKNTSYQSRRDLLSEQIRQVYEDHNQIYGAKKITAVLRQQGIITSDKMVSELMQEMNLYSIRGGAKKQYMRLREDGKKKDALKMNFDVKAPDRVWVSDTTAFKLDKTFYYICVILDLYSRKVIAHKVSRKHSSQLVTGTFKTAYETRGPEIGLTFHSDRGTQYASNAMKNLLAACKVTQSFSPSGKPHHNAVMESFFASLKQEELYRREYHSVVEFRERVAEYMVFFNNKRLHSTLNNMTPNAHEKRFYSRNAPKG